MKVNKRFFLVLSLTFFCTLFVFSGECLSKSGIITKKTLSRTIDPVVVQGKLLQEALGKPIDNLRLYTCKDGEFAPVRYQIDEMTADGDWILPKGMLANGKLSNGTFDTWDKVAFLAEDIGDRAEKEVWPKGYTSASEIKLTDPLNGETGWIYLFYFHSSPPTRSSLPDHLDLNHETTELTTQYWQAKCYISEDGLQSNYYTCMRFFENGGGDGTNFVDRLKIRVTAKMLFGSLAIRFNEEQLRCNELAYTMGPIRIIRRIEQFAQFPLGVKAVRSVADVTQSRNIGSVSAEFDVPFRPSAILSSLKLRAGTDYNENAFGGMLYNSENPQGFLVDGKMDNSELHKFNPSYDKWRLYTGKNGTLMARNIPDKYMDEQIKLGNIVPSTGIIDDVTYTDPPEAVPGCIGYFYQEWDLTKVPRGNYSQFMEFYFIDNYKRGVEIKYLNYWDNPLTISCGACEGKSEVGTIAKFGKNFLRRFPKKAND